MASNNSQARRAQRQFAASVRAARPRLYGQPSSRGTAVVSLFERAHQRQGRCSLDAHFGGCRIHRLLSGPSPEVEWALHGTALDAQGTPIGEGILVWAYDQEHAQDCLDEFKACPYLADLSVGTHSYL